VACLVAKKKPGGDIKAEEFRKENFAYDAKEDRYTCPCGKVMKHVGNARGKANVQSIIFGRCGGWDAKISLT
jgi:hypothetical protein